MVEAFEAATPGLLSAMPPNGTVNASTIFRRQLHAG